MCQVISASCRTAFYVLKISELSRINRQTKNEEKIRMFREDALLKLNNNIS